MEDPAIAAELEQWKSQLLEGNEQAIEYVYSPAWRTLMHRVWLRYSELEERRMSSSTPRLSWQDEVEERRAFIEPELAKEVEILSVQEWTLCPLWVLLNKYLGRRDPDPTRRRFGWASALSDWDQMLQLYDENDVFRAAMSSSQESSLLLLKHWWTVTYCDEDLLEATKTFLQSQKDEEILFDPTDDLEEYGSATRTDMSLYHSTCFKLFLLELHPRSWFPFMTSTVQMLQSTRHNASFQSAAQKMASAVLDPTVTSPHQGEPYPRRLNKVTVHEFTQVADLSIKPCYLWDTAAQRTVEVQSLPQCPDYVCISHTWGRWRTRTDAPVPGVPWPVPENKLYDVRDLPAQLLQLGCLYIWLDLFCIPQNRGERAKLEIAKQASIFRGCSRCLVWLHDVESWDGVVEALDWMCLRFLQVTSARNQEVIKETLLSVAVDDKAGATELMKRTPRADDDFDGEPSTWFSSLWTLQESVLCPDMQLYSRHWTRLQDRRGVPIPLRCLMEFIGESKVYFWHQRPEDVPFSDETAYHAALVFEVQDNYRANQKDAMYPGAVKDLFDLQVMTSMEEVLTTGSPMAVFTNANLRQCSSKSRAPAIMSALGITDWYTRSISSEGPQSPEVLVHGMYQLEFLQEAAQKIGALFYDTGFAPQSRTQTGRYLLTAMMPSMRHGTMLPVSKNPGWYGRVINVLSSTPSNRHDHPSVAGWAINGDASVSMSSAGILMTSRDRSTKRIRGFVNCGMAEEVVFAPGHAKLFSRPTDDVLETLRGLQYGSRCLYAVVLYKSGDRVHGTILEEVPLWWPRVKFLLKIGTFRADVGEMPEAVDVNWKVL